MEKILKMRNNKVSEILNLKFLKMGLINRFNNKYLQKYTLEEGSRESFPIYKMFLKFSN